MRTRRIARYQKLTDKELRLWQYLQRYNSAMLWSALPKGALATPGFAQGVNTVTLSPVKVVVPSDAENWTIVSGSDSTEGGYLPLNIPQGQQLAESTENINISFAGEAAGTYFIYALHNKAEENSLTHDPPGEMHGSAGLQSAFKTFFNLPQPLNTPVPRPDYNPALVPQTVVELVDRLTFNKGIAVPSNGVELLTVVWDGSSFTSVTASGTVISSYRSHPSQTGLVHGATPSNLASSLMGRDSGGRTRVTSPALTAGDFGTLDSDARYDEAVNIRWLKANSDSVAFPNEIMRRDSVGRADVTGFPMESPWHHSQLVNDNKVATQGNIKAFLAAISNPLEKFIFNNFVIPAYDTFDFPLSLAAGNIRKLSDYRVPNAKFFFLSKNFDNLILDLGGGGYDTLPDLRYYWTISIPGIGTQTSADGTTPYETNFENVAITTSLLATHIPITVSLWVKNVGSGSINITQPLNSFMRYIWEEA